MRTRSGANKMIAASPGAISRQKIGIFFRLGTLMMEDEVIVAT